MQESDTPPGTTPDGHETIRRRMLHYGIAASIIGLPVGLLLRMPVVWGLAIAGIVVGGLKLRARRHQN